MNDLSDSKAGTQKIKVPLPLLALNSLAMIAIGISISEIFPKHGRPLGLMSIETAWTVLYVSIPVAVLCMIQFFRVIRRERAKIKQ
jgi:hypothetical protein